MKKSSLALGMLVLGAIGTVLVWMIDHSVDATAHLEFFGGTALIGGVAYVLAKLGERR